MSTIHSSQQSAHSRGGEGSHPRPSSGKQGSLPSPRRLTSLFKECSSAEGVLQLVQTHSKVGGHVFVWSVQEHV